MSGQLAIYKGERKDFWETPKEWSRYLVDQWGVNIDVCASPNNAICERYYSEEESCLKFDWPNGEQDVCFMNPPFSNAADFIRFGVFQATKRNVNLILLYKANFETRVWQDCILPYSKFLLFPKGRVNFCLSGEPVGAVPFTTVFAFFGVKMTEERYLSLCQRGHVMMKYPDIIDFDMLS